MGKGVKTDKRFCGVNFLPEIRLRENGQSVFSGACPDQNGQFPDEGVFLAAINTFLMHLRDLEPIFADKEF